MVFVIDSVIGMYGLGRGLAGKFEPSQGISLPWLAVTGVAFIFRHQVFPCPEHYEVHR